MAQRLIVIGGDAAGMSAASAARRQLPQDQLEIVAFERGHYTSYSACGIPYFIGKDVADTSELIARTPQQFRDHHAIDARTGQEIVAFERGHYTSYSACGIPYFIGKDVADTTELIARTPQQFRDHHAIDARTGHEVLDIDLHRRAVLVRDLVRGREAWEGFDQLMVATGATPARPPLPGIDAAGIHGVQTLDDGLALRAVLERDRPGRAVVVGAGYIGLELAEALSAWGVDITVIGRPPAPLPALDPDMGALIATAMEGFGMEVRMEETVTGFETHTGKVTAVVTDQATIPTELVILGLGVTPNTTLAADAGIPLGETGAIAVDRRLRTGIEGVWAGGDCVGTGSDLTVVAVEHGKQAAHAIDSWLRAAKAA